MFADFRHATAYVDIETTGLENPEITTISLYDGARIRYYVNGQNLDQFQDDITDYPLIVTYNGKTFDLPVIERF
ncbi:MAG: ribonuclease H-like domain-containing protein [Desulfobacterales bacterium]